jgi:eukaryotic-like serine/threonine-protein kinase
MADVSQSQATYFGKYLLDRELARGGMSRVYDARLRGPGGFEKKLVVKQILPELARDPSFVELFVKEANTLVQMSHPGVVPVYELGVIDGVYFLAMERIEGATIAELLREGPLDEAMVAHIGAEIAEALRYAHERFQIVHRDVTTRNVIVDDAGHARLLDFGIAAPVELTGHGELFGSPGYMAPEQLRGEALGPETDLFSLGAVLYEAACGRPALTKIRSATDLPYPPTHALNGLHLTLSAVIADLLRSERALRPSRAGDVAATLRTWLAEHHPTGVTQELAERARRAHVARDAVAASAASSPTTASHDGPQSGPVEVRSIATSPALTELLKQATERIERIEPPAAPHTADDPLADPDARAALHRFLRDIVVITAALWVAIYWANHYPLDRGAPDPVPIASAASPRPVATSPTVPVAAAPEPSAPSPEPPSAAPENPPAAQEPSAQTASLTVNAVPWAEVRLDGRSLGVTPHRKLAVSAGKHTLTLDCPPLGRSTKVPLQARPGQALQVLVDMQSDPPKVSLR